MKKRFLFPLIGIGVFGVSGIIAGTALALTAPNFSKSIKQDYMKFALYNLDNSDILYDFDSLRNYLLDYNVIDSYNYNNLTDIKVSVNNDNNESEYYSYDFQFNFADSTKKIINNVETRIPVGEDIANFINFDNLIKLFSTANDISTLYDLFYTSSGSQVVNYLVDNCGFQKENIDYAVLNITNSYNNTVANTIKFNLKIHLNDGYFYNGNQYINVDLYSNCTIDWDSYSKNATQYFTFGQPGVITGLTKLGMQQQLLVIPSTYVDKYGDTQPITSVNNLASNINLLVADGNQNPTISANIIIMPNSITSIGNNFLYNEEFSNTQLFPNLKWINISSAVSTIGANAFRNVKSIDNINFDNCESLISIGNNAFNSTYMYEFTMPNTVVSLSDYVFANLNSGSKEGASKKLDLNLSRSLNALPNYCFYNSRINNSLVLPNGIIKLNDSAFEGSDIQRINIPYSVTSTGSHCFKTSKFENIVFPEHDELNAIKFGNYSLQYIATNIFILGKYDAKGVFNNLVYQNKDNQFIFFNDYSTYEIYTLPGGTHPNAVWNGRIQYINNQCQTPYNQDALNKVIKRLTETFTSLADIKTFWDNVSNNFMELNNEFGFLMNSNWIQKISVNGNYDGDNLVSIDFSLTINPYWDLEFTVPLQSSLYFPQHPYYDVNGKVIITNDIINEINTILNNFFIEHAVKQSSNMDTVLGGADNKNTLISLLNEKIQEITNGNFPPIEINVVNVWGGNVGWTTNESGYKQVQINIGFKSSSNNSNFNNFIVESDNDLGYSTGSYNGRWYVITKPILTSLK